MTRRLWSLLVVLLLIAFGGAPIAAVLLEALAKGGPHVFAEALDGPGRVALQNTLVVSFGAAVFAFAVGTTLGILLQRTDLPGRKALAAIFTLPLAIPPYLWAMGFLGLLAPRAGLFNRLFGEVVNPYGLSGIAFMLGFTALPIVLLAVTGACQRIDPSLEEAARLCGAGRMRAVTSVTLPLVLPTALSSAGLAFLFAAASFGLPYLLGVSARPPAPVLTTRIYALSLQGGAGDQARALALCTVLLVLAVAVLALSDWLGRKGRVRLSAGKGISARPMPLGRIRLALGVLVWSAAGLLVVLPLLAIAFGSVQRSFGALPSLESLTLAHWRTAFSARALPGAALRSLIFAIASSTVVVSFGLSVALLKRSAGRLGKWLEWLSVFPYAVPGTVLAVGLIVVYGRDVRFIAADRLAHRTG